MPSTKALAAIGLTLCLIIPIGLGYVLSIDEEPVTNWQTTNQSNISNLLLNNNAPYFGSYKGASNNANLLGGDSAAPNYVTVTSNYSSLPIYDETSISLINEATITTYQSENNRPKTISPTSITIPGTDPTAYDEVLIGTHDLYLVSAVAFAVTYPDNTYKVGLTLFSDVIVYRDSPTTWSAIYARDGAPIQVVDSSDTITPGFTNWGVTAQPAQESIGALSAAVGIADYISLSNSSAPASISLINSAMKIGDNYYGGNHNLRITSTTIILDGAELEYDFSTNPIQIASVNATNAITSAPNGQYADPAAGWETPNNTETFTWLNNQLNQSVTFYLKPRFVDGYYVTMGDLTIYPDGQTIKAYLDEDSDNAQTLGQYRYLQVVVSTTGYTVTGLANWPTMGTAPTTYNTLTFDRASTLFDNLSIKSYNGGAFRVDNANIVQGYYPDTLNATLNLNELYPNVGVDIYLNSIGLYGSSLRIAGTTYDVDSSTGSIEVDGTTIRLLHAHLSAWQTEGGYSVRINGVQVAITETLPEIYFGGEWSLTATAYKMEPVTDSQLTWHAGEFSLNKDSFAAAVVVTAVLMILILGMTGGRSMTKMGFLLLVCGGAALVAMIML